MRFWQNSPVEVRENVSLAEMTTWKIGGAAEFFAAPKNATDLAALLKLAAKAGVAFRILGGGSNVLIPDGVVGGLILRLDPGGELGDCRLDDEGLFIAGAAMTLPALVRAAARGGRSGLEDVAGLPGTVGGGLNLNAGSPERGIGGAVVYVEGVDRTGRLVRRGADECGFGYRTSALDDLVITRAAFRLTPGDPGEVRENIRLNIERKNRTQPTDKYTAGCVFKNPPGISAGSMIDELGLKGRRIGAAVVSAKHANFIENAGRASSAEVRRLIDLIRREVRRAHGIDLELEVRVWE